MVSYENFVRDAIHSPLAPCVCMTWWFVCHLFVVFHCVAEGAQSWRWGGGLRVSLVSA